MHLKTCRNQNKSYTHTHTHSNTHTLEGMHKGTRHMQTMSSEQRGANTLSDVLDVR